MRPHKWLYLLRKKGKASSSTQESEFAQFLEQSLKIVPRKKELYEQAFRHVTVSNRKEQSNERLEFIGDAILDAIVAEIVYARFPDNDEGFLSKMKSAVVNRKALNKLARDMQLEPWIRARVRNRQAMHVIGGNVLEALIGAMFIDHGYTFTHDWVKERIVKKLGFSRLKESLKDAKSTLYEKAHSKNAELRFDTQPSGNEFESTVYWNDETLASAKASSKKDAEQRAARKSLTIIIEG